MSRVSCQKGPTRHAYTWQIGPFWQDTLDMYVVIILTLVKSIYVQLLDRWMGMSEVEYMSK